MDTAKSNIVQCEIVLTYNIELYNQIFQSLDRWLREKIYSVKIYTTFEN